MSSVCGIVDFYSRLVDFDTLRDMGKAMVLRGRGESGAYINGGVGFHHNRMLLSGEKGSRQPYTEVIGGNKYTVVFDGELRGIGALSEPCGEGAEKVILELYAAFGYDCAEHLEGSFAFAVYDETRREIFLARDALGAKPLYYLKDGSTFVFASEIKGLVRYFKDGIEADAEAVKELILSPAGVIRGCEVYKGINELPEGCAALHTPLDTRLWKYKKAEADTELTKWKKNGTAVLCPDREAVIDDGGDILHETLTAFDYPAFDEYTFEYVKTLKANRSLERVFIEDGALRFGLRYALERADRLGMMNGVLAAPMPCSEDKGFKRSVLIKTEKKLSDTVGKLFAGGESDFLKFFSRDILDKVEKERDVQSRLRTYARILQCETWIKTYGIVPT